MQRRTRCTTSGRQRWIAEHDADSARPVGSLMKLLTAFVVMQAGDPTHVATVPAMQLDTSESSIGLYDGERLSREVLLPRHVDRQRQRRGTCLGGRCRWGRAGLCGSDERSCAGVGDGQHHRGQPHRGSTPPDGQSSAHDMVVLATVLMDDPTFRATVARTDARLHGSVFPSTNPLLSSYDGATGVKTGHTTGARYCIVASATRDGRPVIVAVLGAPSEKARNDGATALLDWAFTQ